MDNEVLVRPGTTGWIVLARLIGPVLVFIGIMCQVNQLPIAMPLIVAGIGFAVVVEIYAFVKNGRRRWVEDVGAGIKVIDSNGVRQYSDEQVSALSLYEIQKHSEGTLKSVKRHFIVWVDSEPSPIEMENVIPVGHGDPLGELINRILEKYRQRCDADLQQGREIVGDGWALSNSMLTIGRQPAANMIPIDQISAVDIFDNKLCIWKHGDEQATARFELNTRNVHLLHLLLAARIKDTGEAHSLPGEHLGRILFERKTGMAAMVLAWLFVPVALLVGFALMADRESLFVGAGILLVGVLLVVFAIHLKKASFRCQEFGVCRTGLFGETKLRYQDVASFTYSATRQFVNGSYTGTTLGMNFVAIPVQGAKNINYNTSVQAADDDLDQLRDHIAHIIAARMAEDYNAQGQVEWTDALTIRNDGILYTPSGFFGRKDPVLLPWDRYNGFDMQQGTFHIFEIGKPKSVAQEQASAANFYPGFDLLIELCHSEDEEPEE